MTGVKHSIYHVHRQIGRERRTSRRAFEDAAPRGDFNLGCIAVRRPLAGTCGAILDTETLFLEYGQQMAPDTFECKIQSNHRIS